MIKNPHDLRNAEAATHQATLHVRPTWLPRLQQSLMPEMSQVIVTEYRAETEELCGVMSEVLLIEQDAVWTEYLTADSIVEQWEATSGWFTVAVICATHASAPHVIRRVLVRCDKATGQLFVYDEDGILDR